MRFIKKVRTWQKRYVRTFYMLFALKKNHTCHPERRREKRAGVEVLRSRETRSVMSEAKPAPKGRDLREITAIFSAFIYFFLYE